MAGRKPDYRIGAMNKAADVKGYVGAAWLDKENGRISIRLDAFIRLDASPDLVITLFPETDRPTRLTATDDIPF